MRDVKKKCICDLKPLKILRKQLENFLVIISYDP